MTDKTRLQIAHKLKEIRLRKKLTQIDVAKTARISANYYARVERAEVTPSVDTLEKITKALNIKSSDILPF